MPRFEIPHDSERLRDVLRRAQATGRVLIQRGSAFLIATHVPAGWHQFGAITK